MPTYEYRCPDGHDFEQFVQKISLSSAELPCPVCGKHASRRISAGSGFVFKGSGFYITDYGKDGKKDQRDHADKVATAKSDAAAKRESLRNEGVKSEGTKGESAGTSDASKTNNSGTSAPEKKSGDGGKAPVTAKGESGAKPAPAAAPPAAPKKDGGKG